MFIETFREEGLSINTYIIGSETEAAVIDATRNIQPVLDCLNRKGFKLKYIFETHIHADFVSGARQLAKETGAVIVASIEGINKKTHYGFSDIQLAKNESAYTVGKLQIKAWHTPGHTPEHMSYLVNDEASEAPLLLFSGDFLFVNSFGRPDLVKEDNHHDLSEALYNTLYGEFMKGLPDSLTILPSHGKGSSCGKEISDMPFTSLGKERKNSPIFSFEGHKEEFYDFILRNLPFVPKYFSELKKLNQQGPTILEDQNIENLNLLSIEEFTKGLQNPAQILDIRQPTSFVLGHIKGSYSIWYHQNLASWAGSILNYHDPIFIISDSEAEARGAAAQLRIIGLDNIVGALKGGFATWYRSGNPIQTLQTLDVYGLRQALKDNPPVLLLDVRSNAEYYGSHIQEAIHIELGKLQDRLSELNADKEYAVICGSGYRSNVAASILQKAGFKNIKNVLGGMNAWGKS